MASQKARIVQMLLNGKQPFEVVKELNSNIQYVSRCRKEAGLPTFKPGTKIGFSEKNKPIVELIKAMRSEGHTFKVIAQRVSLSRQRIHQLLEPQKNRSRTLTHNLVNRGKINKPKNCESCGEESDLDGHHTDYGKPTDVQWLCAKCHEVADSKMKTTRELPIISHRMQKTLEVVRGLKSATVLDVAKVLDTNNKLAISAFNGRLSRLESLGLLRRTKVSGMWIYAAV